MENGVNRQRCKLVKLLLQETVNPKKRAPTSPLLKAPGVHLITNGIHDGMNDRETGRQTEASTEQSRHEIRI